MNTIDDAEIHQIVQRVLKQLTGASADYPCAQPHPRPLPKFFEFGEGS